MHPFWFISSVSACHHRSVSTKVSRRSERQGRNYWINPLAHRTENILSSMIRMVWFGRQLWYSSPVFPQTNKTRAPQKYTSQNPNSRSEDSPKEGEAHACCQSRGGDSFPACTASGIRGAAAGCSCFEAGGGARSIAQLGHSAKKMGQNSKMRCPLFTVW